MLDHSLLIQRLNLISLSLALLAPWHGQASEAAGLQNAATSRPGTNQSAFRVEMRCDSGPDVLTARRVYLTAGTNRFAFLVPDGFNLRANDGDQVQMVSKDNDCTLSVSLLPNSIREKLTAAAARSHLFARYPQAEVLNEFSLAAASQNGPAFDLLWLGAGQLRQAARAAFIPSRAGTLLFWLSTSSDKLSKMVGELRFVMLTFCASDEQGRLEVLPLSNKL